MSTVVESVPVAPATIIEPVELIKPVMTDSIKTQRNTSQSDEKISQQHPLHQFDATKMSKFYESCVAKLHEQYPKWKASEWTKATPMPVNQEQSTEQWLNPMVFSSKQRIYETIRRLARETGEPMIMMPNFDYGDILNFQRFLQALKMDGINAIAKYKQYLNNKDIRKQEIDLVVVHPKYGVMLFEVKDCDHLDAKRRTRTRMLLNHATSCFKSLGRLISEAKGWSYSEASMPIVECIALPNVEERPMSYQPSNLHNQSTSSTGSQTTSSRHVRTLHYMVKSDLENPQEFAKWWKTYIVDSWTQKEAELAEANKVNKFDDSAMTWFTGLIMAVRNNSILPVVYSEQGVSMELGPNMPKTDELVKPIEVKSEMDLEKEKEAEIKMKEAHFSPALNINAEFFTREHESVRSLSKVVVTAKSVDLIRKTICKQILWVLLNDHQKKISVVCSEMNKHFYEEFIMRQRKVYSNCRNIRFYTNLDSCTLDGQHSTLKKDVETWFFDNGLNKPLENVMERARELESFWVFTVEEEKLMSQWKSDLETMKVKHVKLDKSNETMENTVSLLNETSFKLPLRMQCDVLVIGDLVGTEHLKTMYRGLTNTNVCNLSYMYTKDGSEPAQHRAHHHNNQSSYKLGFNPVKRFKTVKFIRGGSIENLRNSLKMHDSIQAQVVLMHIGDEDLFKSRSSVTTTERIKEMANLVKEYCPKSFIVLSSLMRRISRTESAASNEVNKGIRDFCKQTKETSNFFYMLNSNFEPELHTQEGRMLTDKGTMLYMDNLLFFVDHFMHRNHKQH